MRKLVEDNFFHWMFYTFLASLCFGQTGFFASCAIGGVILLLHFFLDIIEADITPSRPRRGYSFRDGYDLGYYVSSKVPCNCKDKDICHDCDCYCDQECDYCDNKDEEDCDCECHDCDCYCHKADEENKEKV